MKKSKKKIDLFIVLFDLTAEGCPILALNLIEELKKNKLEILLLTFRDTNNELLNEFKERNIETISYKLDSTGFYRYFKILYYSFIFAKKYKPKSILCFPMGWHTFVAIGAKLGGIKNVCTHAGNLAPNKTNSEYWKFRLLLKLGDRLTNRIICCSKYIESSVIKNFRISESKTTTIYNSFNEKKFKFSRIFALNSKVKNKEVINIGMVGRFESHKDQKSLIKAIKILKNRGLFTKLFLVGDGSLKEELIELSNNLNLSKEVYFLGARNDIESVLNKFDIFAFSTTVNEGFGIAMAEAMGKGLPIIASDVGACRETLHNGKCGTLFKAHSALSIANNIEKILSDLNQTNNKRKYAYEYAIKNFTKKKMAINYLRELELKR